MPRAADEFVRLGRPADGLKQNFTHVRDSAPNRDPLRVNQAEDIRQGDPDRPADLVDFLEGKFISGYGSLVEHLAIEQLLVPCTKLQQRG